MSKLPDTRAHTLTTAADGTWETTQPNVKEKMQIKSECLVINISIFEYFLAEWGEPVTTQNILTFVLKLKQY